MNFFKNFFKIFDRWDYIYVAEYSTFLGEEYLDYYIGFRRNKKTGEIQYLDCDSHGTYWSRLSLPEQRIDKKRIFFDGNRYVLRGVNNAVKEAKND